MLDSTSSELNAMVAVDPAGLSPFDFGKHALFLVWMGLYEKALEQLAASTDDQLFTTAAIRAYQFAVTFMHLKAPVADFDTVCDRYRLSPNPVSKVMFRPFLRPGVKVEPSLTPTFKVFEGDDTEELVVYLNTSKSYATWEDLTRYREYLAHLDAHPDTKPDAQLCSIFLGYCRHRSAEVEALCWEALELRPNNCQVQQALLMVLHQLGRHEEAAMEATRFATMYGGRTRAKWTATRYRKEAEVEPYEPDLKGKGKVKALVNTRQLADRLLKAADEKRVQLFRNTLEGRQAWGRRLEAEFSDALRVDKVDLEAQPPPSQVFDRALTANAREFGRLILYLAWSGRYNLVAELANTATEALLLQASTLSAIRLAASAVCSSPLGKWREPKLALAKTPRTLLLQPNLSIRLMNPLTERKWMPDRERHSYFASDSSYEDYVLVNLAAWQLDKDTLVRLTVDSLRKNAADVDALVVAAYTLLHFERFETAAELAFRAWRYQPQDSFLQRLLRRSAELAKRDDLVEDVRAWVRQSPVFVPQDAVSLGVSPESVNLWRHFSPRFRNHRALKKSFRRLYRRINKLLRRATNRA